MTDTPSAARYAQSKERSAELLRLALMRMSAHAAALNPTTFTVWYEHLSGMNAELSGAFERAERDDPTLDDGTIRRLYEEHVLGARERATAKVGGGLELLIKQIGDAAARTGDDAGQYGQSLATLAQALRPEGLAAIPDQLADVHARTARMSQSLDALQQQLVQSHAEVGRLRNELQSLRSEAMTCPLTGVLNRKGFDERLAEMLAAPTSRGHDHALVMLDIDHFKKVNDTHGHVLGDRVLEAMGRLLREGVTDAAASVARYGGEEFAILLPGSGLARAHEVAEQVRGAISRIKLRQRKTDVEVLRVTASAGVALARPMDSATQLIQRADAALYAAKQSGRDRTVIAEDAPVPMDSVALASV